MPSTGGVCTKRQPENESAWRQWQCVAQRVARPPFKLWKRNWSRTALMAEGIMVKGQVAGRQCILSPSS